ncbi:tetratricopeptide repeat protein [Mesonia sp. HuA40]|uniref:tetratricopeptide repeat-containing sensor histidine kinase n=1 Tax=Mesonia sp. HuA40 TaxID=2602761 RepID=UPI00164FC172|nr:tetratricopeptide repeat protein [Mesonia sp. HuA40]
MDTELFVRSPDSTQVLALINRSRELHKKKQQDSLEFALARQAILLAEKLNDTLLMARANDNLGLLYRYHKNYSTAFAYHQRAFEWIENKSVDKLYKMIFANNAGVASRYDQKYATAVDFYMKALQLAEEEEDLRNIAIASNGIGNALSQIPGKQKESLAYFNRSLKAEQQRGNKLGTAMNYLSIADYHIETKNYVLAKSYLNRLLRINQEMNSVFGLAIAYEYLGLTYLEESKNLTQAVIYYKKALAGYVQLENRHKEAEVLHQLGHTFLNKKNYTQASNYIQQSQKLATTNKQTAVLQGNYELLAQLHEEQNQFADALKHYKWAQAYADSLKIHEQNVKIDALTKQYNLAKKENEIALLKKDKALQAVKLANQNELLAKRNLISFFLGVSLLLILIILYLQSRNYKERKATNARINQEEKEKLNAIYERNLARAEILVTRLRINPHFLFNSLNAITYLIQIKQNEKAIKYLKLFSRYTRMVLETSKQHVISLSEELKLANYYLQLEENRFEQDLEIQFVGANNTEIQEVKIPPLLLQPFLENAIWHGLMLSDKKKKKISIVINHNTTKTSISITDNGVGRQPKPSSQKKHKSMGVSIIKERIELYNKSFQGEITYRIVDLKDEYQAPQGTQVILNIYPQKRTEMNIAFAE